MGTWSIFKTEKSRRIWKPCERTSRIILSVCCQFCILVLLFNSNSSSFTSNLCGFPNGVFIRIRLTRRGSSPLTRTFTSKRVFLGKIMCVWMVS